MHHKIPRKPWEVIGADIFTLHNKNCIVDYHSNFPIKKKMEDNLILACKIILLEHGLPRNIMSDADNNFISEEIEKFHKRLNIECAASSSYHYQSNGQVEACIKLTNIQ